MNRTGTIAAIIGCGQIGTRRAKVVAASPGCRVGVVVDADEGAARRLAGALDCPWSTDWRDVLESSEAIAVIVSTPTGFLARIAIEALERGKHVLMEKPMGRNLREATAIAAAAAASSAILKIGFNHRYHPAIAQAHGLIAKGEIGPVINIRARYGHGGRPGYEREWRCDPEVAGGGELIDQGVHIADLIHWIAGVPERAFAYLQTAHWPITPLEDNAFGLFRFPSGAIASVHTSWTQWKNLFSLEVHGELGSASIDGLGGSYGPERLVVARRNPGGGAPASTQTAFDGPDLSWQLEWEDFLHAIRTDAPYWGTATDGVTAMRMIDALYRSARTRSEAMI